MSTTILPVTGEPAADQLLVDDPLALLLGMLLDQQFPMERAFVAPYRLQERRGRKLDAAELAAADPDEIAEVFRQPPALHRYWGAMAKRTQALCQILVDEYGGDAEALWRDVPTGAELLKRLRALPGFGAEKSKIFMALLAKRFGVRPEGWEKAASPFDDDEPRSVADIDTPENFQRVRAWKQAKRAAGKTKQE